MDDTSSSIDLEIAALGALLKTERKRQGLSVQALSSRSGVSFGLISQLERGLGNPSFASLHRLSSALGVPMSKLLAGDPNGDGAVVRLGDRFMLPTADGPESQRVVRELVTPRQHTTMQLIRSTLPPGFSNEGQPFRHLGTECVLVESGSLRVVHGEREVVLEEGDAMTYGCSVPHWWANASDGTTVVLGAVSPFEA
ncbi:helix-turn-helix domain-containing protein [Salinibacterium sp. dk2585]|uniref:helix-turn-helix domain-containing protein n=1 Tax=unclassified Salinibacterium TaxID=2632331 RepID=UPI0011C25632|nr:MULTISPECIES: XRE family transcriptional regulator [unclassified Salinibacterium]QEE60771.1 helix-turn-helix domain-containing protein [Salinibacterium sp. dk2585]TXK55843.1 helix-turn-helix domain-containing protein [Salinibacterium sp. dk5596]